MKKEVEKIVKKNDFLFLYSAGTGGEFLTSAISECAMNLNTIKRHSMYNNRWVTVCKVGYSSIVLRDQNTHNEDYTGENDPLKNNIFKDHPVNTVFDIWPSYMTAIHLCVTENYNYWAELTWGKLHNININVEKSQFVNDHAEQIRQDYFNRNLFRQYFDNYYQVDITDISRNLKSIFSNFDENLFNKIYTRWVEKNNE